MILSISSCSASLFLSLAYELMALIWEGDRAKVSLPNDSPSAVNKKQVGTVSVPADPVAFFSTLPSALGVWPMSPLLWLVINFSDGESWQEIGGYG